MTTHFAGGMPGTRNSIHGTWPIGNECKTAKPQQAAASTTSELCILRPAFNPRGASLTLTQGQGFGEKPAAIHTLVVAYLEEFHPQLRDLALAQPEILEAGLVRNAFVYDAQQRQHVIDTGKAEQHLATAKADLEAAGSFPDRHADKAQWKAASLFAINVALLAATGMTFGQGQDEAGGVFLGLSLSSLALGLSSIVRDMRKTRKFNEKNSRSLQNCRNRSSNMKGR